LPALKPHNAPVLTLVRAEAALIDRVLDATYALWHDGLSRVNYGKFHAAQTRTPWGVAHQRMYALVDGDHLLASAKRYDLTAVIHGTRSQVCGLGAVFTAPAHRGRGYAGELIERLLAQASEDGAALALLFSEIGPEYYARQRFEVVPAPPTVPIRVAESARYGAPMTMIRGGDARDLEAIAAMGRSRAAPAAFHLERSAGFIQHGITKKRLLAGLGRPGARELHFFIAEEGLTAAAYVVVSVAGSVWTIEECGDRDPTGARVGAILQALIAREPHERRPTITAWLPPGFAPPQVTLGAATPSPAVMMMRALDRGMTVPQVSSEDVLYWRSDLF
jgi:GNAT superfamily N-acetyltransferase